MNTFVLVMVIALGRGVSSGVAMATLPGYPTMETCQAAAAELKKADGYWFPVCIPGPPK